MSLFSKTKFVLVAAFTIAYAVWFWYTSQSTHQLSPIDFRVVETQTVIVNDNNLQQHPALVNLALLAKDDTDTVVLVYASYSYRATLFNWLVAFRNTNQVDPSTPHGGVLVVCLDQALSDYLVSLGWHCFLDSSTTTTTTTTSTSLDKNTVKTLWVTRVKQIVELISAGINVLLTDSDAVWIKDVRHTLLADGGDVVSSRANFPYNSPWGSTLCMGLVLFRSNPQVLHLAKLALEETIKVQDDQIGFNNVLFTLKPVGSGKLRSNPFGSPQKPDGKTPARTKFVLSPNMELSFTLLAHTKVVRVCSLISTEEWEREVEVAHCHVNDGVPLPTNKHKGNSQTHTAILYKYKVFYLREDWENEVTNQTATHQFAALLDRIKA